MGIHATTAPLLCTETKASTVRRNYHHRPYCKLSFWQPPMRIPDKFVSNKAQWCVNSSHKVVKKDAEALQWRHYEHEMVPNHQPRDYLLNSLFRHRWKKSSASLAFVWGIHQWPVNSPDIGPVTRKMFPFDDVIMECNIKWPNVSPLHIKATTMLFNGLTIAFS